MVLPQASVKCLNREFIFWFSVGGKIYFLRFHIDFGEEEWHFETLELVFQEFNDQPTSACFKHQKMLQTSKIKFNCESCSKGTFSLNSSETKTLSS